jgi:uncharacterized membrane protein
MGSFLLLTHKRPTERYWEIDGLRGLAIMLMVSYHFVFDLTLFGIYRTDVSTGVWRVYGRASAVLFLVLAGVSLAVGHARTASRSSARPRWRAYLARGLKLIGWGIVISLVSWAYTGRPVILFGILHLIGAATILAYPFLSLRPALDAAAGAILIVAGAILNPLPVAHAWLVWLGLRPPSLYQLDYFPVLPWFGVVLLGVAAGKVLYPRGARHFAMPEWGRCLCVRQAVWLGQRSLVIYLVHQPVLVGLLTLARLMS